MDGIVKSMVVLAVVAYAMYAAPSAVIIIAALGFLGLVLRVYCRIMMAALRFSIITILVMVVLLALLFSPFLG